MYTDDFLPEKVYEAVECSKMTEWICKKKGPKKKSQKKDAIKANG